MTGQEMVERFAGSNQETPLPGFENIDVLQAVIDDIYSDDKVTRLVVPSPDVTTVAGTLTYSFDPTNDDSLTPILPGVNDIRRIRGIYKPDQAQASLNDYNYRRVPAMDQLVLDKRIYDGSVRIDNERRLVVFASDPGDTTETWKVDYYRKAPTVSLTRRIPVIEGWEMRLVFKGMKAVFEEWTTGNSGDWRSLFDAEKDLYFAALDSETNLPRIDENEYILNDPFVEPS